MALMVSFLVVGEREQGEGGRVCNRVHDVLSMWWRVKVGRVLSLKAESALLHFGGPHDHPLQLGRS